MKAVRFVALFVAFVLFCAFAQAESFPSKSGASEIVANPHGSRTMFKIEEMKLSMDMGIPIYFSGNFDFCVLPGKNPDEIQNPTQYTYKKAGDGNQPGFYYNISMFKQGCTVIIKAGSKYLAIKPTKLLLKYRWERASAPISDQYRIVRDRGGPIRKESIRQDVIRYNSSKEANDALTINSPEDWEKLENILRHGVFTPDKGGPWIPTGNILSCKWRYWPSAVSSKDSQTEAGVRSAEIPDWEHFELVGLSFSWDVNKDNTLWLNYEPARNFSGEVKFAVSKQSELKDVDFGSVDFSDAKSSRSIKFPLNRIAVFRTSKGCIALRPTKAEDGGKILHYGEMVVPKMVTYEWREKPSAKTKVEPKRAAREVVRVVE